MENFEKTKEKGFDEIMRELETIVEKLEKGGVSLEEAIKIYEHGIKLLRSAEKILKSAEAKVEMLKKEKGEIVAFNEREIEENEGKN